jgi:hypothetical protein
MKRRIEQVDGRDPWQIEIDYYIECGLSPEDAQLLTVVRRMIFGDVKALRAAIVEALRRNKKKKMVAFDGDILFQLVRLIDQGRLIVKPPRRGKAGRPKAPSPDKFARDLIAARRYEQHDKRDGFEAAFKDIAGELGMPVNALKEAVTRWRNTKEAVTRLRNTK